ncbi:Uncharacterized protein GBIM_18155 [Gryllus bimaculatus]|nr:Uncharacterized protein GBIM_18155 [Gryllus bimaculatus]
MVVEEQNTNPDAEFKAPEWINTTLIQKALKKSEEHLKVKDISVKMATTPGENYSSSIYRVTVELSNGECRSFVVKGPPPGQTLREATLELDIFRREGFMLGDVIPQIEAMLEEAAPGQFPPLAARCPLYDREYLVMQDLATAGFKMADRKRGLDLKHSLLALRCLARYHAGTHALLRQKPEIADRLPSMWLKPHPATAAFVEGGVQMAADACRLWPGYEEYATLLDEFKTIAMETFLEVNTPTPDEFTVIVHSDFWVNNMMFRYDEDNPEPKGHRMVDFQGSTVGSPTLDLLYFLSTSVTEEVSADNEDLLIREYHRTLDDTLRLLRLEVQDISVEMGTAPGDNYSSCIYRVRATLSDGSGLRRAWARFANNSLS